MSVGTWRTPRRDVCRNDVQSIPRSVDTLAADFCIEAVEEALRQLSTEVFNTDQGNQLTTEGFTGFLEHYGV